MTTHPLPSRTLPAPWTPAHRALLARLEEVLGHALPDAHPESLMTTTVIADVDGLPAGVVASRVPVVTAARCCQCWRYHDRVDPGDLGLDRGSGRDG
jgi:hypothetical protein